MNGCYATAKSNVSKNSFRLVLIENLTTRVNRIVIELGSVRQISFLLKVVPKVIDPVMRPF